MKKSTLAMASALLLASSAVFAQTATTRTAAECEAMFATNDINTDGMIDATEMKTVSADMLAMMQSGSGGSDNTATGNPTTANPDANAAAEAPVVDTNEATSATSGTAAAAPSTGTGGTDSTATGDATTENPDANATAAAPTVDMKAAPMVDMKKEAFLAACTKA